MYCLEEEPAIPSSDNRASTLPAESADPERGPANAELAPWGALFQMDPIGENS